MRNKLVFVAATLIVGLSLAENTHVADSQVKTKKQKPSIEERMRRRYVRTGGMVENRKDMTGNFTIANCQKRLLNIDGEKCAAGYADLFRCEFRFVESAAPTVVTAAEKVKSLGANAAVFIIEDADLPALLGAPEERWAIVNVAKLATQGCTEEKLKTRVSRELMRAIGYVCGTDCLGTGAEAHPILSPADLEYRMTDGFTVESMIKTADYLPKIGIVSYQKATYKQACQEGWANCPTDEVQKAIWDSIHNTPSKPIKITYDKGKQKPVVK